LQLHHQSPTLRTAASQGAPFKRKTLIVAMLGTTSLLQPSLTNAADEPQIEALQKENAALRKELDVLKGARAASSPASAASAAEAPAAAASQASQAPALASVVVRSRKPLQAVKDVPQSISVVSGDELKQTDSTSLEAITKRLSNVKWNYGNSSTSNYSIRGLGKIANNQAADPSVGLYVDGVPYAYNQLGSFEFHDVDTAAVFRGPQGFAFGKNSSIGAIQVQYKRPSFVPSTEVTLGYNQYQGQHYGNANGNVTASAVATGPIEDGLLAYRTSLRVNKGGGWILNSYNTDNQYISSDRVSGRMQFLLTLSPDVDARLSVEVNPRMSENVNIGSTNFFFGATPANYANGAPNATLTTEGRLGRRWFTRNGSYTVGGNYYNQEFIASDSQQGVVTGSNGALLEFNWALNGQHKLSAITAFKDYYFNAFRDDEGTVFDVQTAAGNQIRYSQYSQELRLVSRLGDDLTLTSGLLAMKTRNSTTSNAIFGADAGAWFANGGRVSPTGPYDPSLPQSQYGRLDNDAAGRLLMVDSLDGLWRHTPLQAKSRHLALYASGDWKATERINLNAGARVTQENRQLTQSSGVVQDGHGRDLNPVALGGFNSNGAGVLDPGNTAEQLAIADQVALRYFGVTSYALLTPEQRRQVADAKAIRSGRIGALYPAFTAERVRKRQYTWSVSPSFKLDEDISTYLTLAHGEKSGVPGVLATTGTPTSYLVRPEKNNALELGLKSTLLGGQWLFNTAVFVNDIKDYQQTVFLVDEYATANNGGGPPVYVAAPGNVPKVRAKGVELDTVFSGVRNLELRFSGAYNDARYKSYPTAALPVERANEGSYYDASGRTLPGASKWSFNVGASYRQPVFGDKLLVASFSTSYASRFNSDNNLSEYGWISGYYLTDVALAIGGHDGRWTLNTFVKNVFNDGTPRNRTWNAWAPSFPRQYGVVLSTRL
jgi:outer membrane receptor protein involved in Fe transport